MLTDSEGNLVIDNTPQTIQAFEPNTAYSLTYMMQNAVEHGTGKEAALWTMPVAGKTGSSTDYQDRWFVGCTPYYVAAVWTGYDMPERIWVNGNPAAQLWKKVMAPIHDGLPWQSFTWPYLGENTGLFGIEEDDYLSDEYLDEDFLTENDFDSNGGDSYDGSYDGSYGGGDSFGGDSFGGSDYDDGYGGGDFGGSDDFGGDSFGGDDFLNDNGGFIIW